MEIAGRARCRTAGARPARRSRADRPRAPLSVAALRRRAAARGDRARAGQRSADPAGRRADGQPRLAPTAGTSWTCCCSVNRAAADDAGARDARRRRWPRSPSSQLALRDGRAVTDPELTERPSRPARGHELRPAHGACARRAPSWRRLLFFFLCIAIGVGAIVALRSVIQNVRGVLTGRGPHADRGRRPGQRRRSRCRPTARQALDARARGERGVTTRTESIETATMVRPADARQGHRADGGAARRAAWLPALRHARSARRHAVSPRAAARPRRAGAARAADAARRPRSAMQILIGRPAVHHSRRHRARARAARRRLQPRPARDRRLRRPRRRQACSSFGSRARYQVMLQGRRAARRTPHGGSDCAISGTRFVTVRSYRSTEDDIGEDLQRAENYLSLVGLVVVVLGGIGVSSVTRVFIEQKLKSIAVLKCVGAGTCAGARHLPAAGACCSGWRGSLMGVGARARRAGRRARPALGNGGRHRSPLVPRARRRARCCRRSASACWSRCCSRSCRCCGVRHVKPSLLLRAAGGGPRGGVDWLRAGVTVARRVRRWSLLAGWQAGSWRVGLVVCGGFCGARRRAARRGLRAGPGRSAPLARARVVRACATPCCNLNRPGNQTRIVLLAVGLGALLHPRRSAACRRTCCASSRIDVGDRLARHVPDRHPAGSGRRRLRAFLSERTGRTRRRRCIPVLRARVTQVRGKRDDAREARGRARARLARPRVHDHLSSGARARTSAWSRAGSGTRTPSPAAGGLDRGGHSRSLQDQRRRHVRFDVLGQPIEAKVTSVRAGELARRPRRRLHVRVPAGRARPGAARLHRARSAGPATSTRARATAARPGRAFPERLGDRPPRGARDGPRA